jgi:hypothetical protein
MLIRVVHLECTIECPVFFKRAGACIGKMEAD